MKPVSTKPRILIVDDEPLNIEVLGAALEELGDIMFATDGPSALDIARAERPDIILLDVMMPGMDGYAVCRELKDGADTADIPVVFVTALSDDTDEAKGIEMGAIDYLTKPINVPIVLARLRNHLELKRYRDHLAEIAFIDGLTGIANRRWFEEHLANEWQRALRHNESLAILLIDIDHFKQFNDHYGHQAGDACLHKVAQALTASVNRPADLVARYGGEEFICILPETDSAGAEVMGKALNRAVAKLAVPHGHSSTADHVTVSIGGAARKIDRDHSRDDLIAAADENLYKVKRAGRDGVIVGASV